MPKLTAQFNGTDWFYTVSDSEGWLASGRAPSLLDVLIAAEDARTQAAASDFPPV